ncbi:hypothetical protein [Xenorhabdus stockiae]|uniref:hypothetical protein n=1 Tax=Xenorhabdus stockiae TaxID=351614 RepID=UPI004063DABE
MKKTITFIASILLTGGCTPSPEVKIKKQIIGYWVPINEEDNNAYNASVMDFKENGEVVNYPFLCMSGERKINYKDVMKVKYSIIGNEVYLTDTPEKEEQPDIIITDMTENSMKTSQPIWGMDRYTEEYYYVSYQKISKIEPLCWKEMKNKHIK